MRGRGLMLVAGMRAGERRAEASQQQQQAQQHQPLEIKVEFHLVAHIRHQITQLYQNLVQLHHWF